jgi:deoxyribose-phosphate aldolase
MQLNKYIDHTVLKPTTLISEIEKLCSEAMQYNFAAVCVPPPFVKKSKELLKESEIKAATVIGFPVWLFSNGSKTCGNIFGNSRRSR